MTLAPYAYHARSSTGGETRVFTVIDEVLVDVEGSTVRAWKVEEHRQADRQLLAAS